VIGELSGMFQKVKVKIGVWKDIKRCTLLGGDFASYALSLLKAVVVRSSRLVHAKAAN
jgi:hypothetical protein